VLQNRNIEQAVAPKAFTGVTGAVNLRAMMRFGNIALRWVLQLGRAGSHKPFYARTL